MKTCTLVFLIKKNNNQEITDICLAMKKRGFGAGRWNGVGGKVLEGESIEEAALREAKEEIGVTIQSIYQIAKLQFTFPHAPAFDQKVSVYFATEWAGEPTESEEMNPQWYKVSDIPYTTMWPADIYWLPQVIAGKLIDGHFTFGEGDAVAAHEVRYLGSL